MRNIGIIFILCGLIVIFYPQIIAYIIGGILLFLWLNLAFAWLFFAKNGKDKEYVKFGNYKIYKD